MEALTEQRWINQRIEMPTVLWRQIQAMGREQGRSGAAQIVAILKAAIRAWEDSDA
jgi:hypothetical protein